MSNIENKLDKYLEEDLNEVKKGTKQSAVQEIAMIVKKTIDDNKQLKRDIANRIEDAMQNESYGSDKKEAQEIADNVISLMFENDRLDFSIYKVAQKVAREALKQAKA